MAQILIKGIFETLYMTLMSTAIAYVIGLPLGMILVATDPDGITPRPFINRVLGTGVNILRSVPFIILLISILGFTRLIVGTTIGSTATIVPLSLAAFPFVARMVQSSLKEVDSGVIEAALSAGATPFQILCKVILPEATPSLIVGAAIAVTTILGYSTMAGFVGGGGLGAIAINYGYYKYDTKTMLITVALLVVIVQLFQEIGSKLSTKIDHRN